MHCSWSCSPQSPPHSCDGEHDLVLIGVVDANDVVVTPRVQARLDSLLVDEGSEVKAGQLIARLESSELAAQAASVAASASGAVAQLSESRSSALQVTGTTEASLSAARSRLASAKATLAREQAQLTQDSADAARAQMVARSGGLAPADVDRAMNAYHAQQSIVSRGAKRSARPRPTCRAPRRERTRWQRRRAPWRRPKRASAARGPIRSPRQRV